MEPEILTREPPYADARLAYGEEPSQFGDLRLPAGPGPHPTLVVIHGGFWRAAYGLDHLGHLSAAHTSEGWATWSLEYRRVGEAGGGWPGTFHDVAQGVDHLRALAEPYALDLGRVVVLGHSAGGHLACWLAARPRIPRSDPLYRPDPLPVRGVVSLAGVLDLRRASALGLSRGAVDELLGGSPGAVPERYATASPAELLPLGVPQVLVHGTADDQVPFALSATYAESARRLGDPVDLVALPDVGHFEPIDPHSPAWPTVRNAATQVLEMGNG